MGRIAIRVVPRASRDEVAGFDDAGRLRVRVTAPPVEGAANRAVVAVLARALGVPRGKVAVVHGGSARSKVIEVEGLTEDAIRSALENHGE